VIYDRNSVKRLGAILLLLLVSPVIWAQQPVEVALAGFAFSGSANTIDLRFPYSRRYEATKKNSGMPVYQLLSKQLQATPPANFKIVAQIDELKGRDQALAVALVIGNESVSDEKFGALHKLMVFIRGQAVFFDFKSMSVVRSYPISFAYVDVLDHAATPDEIMARVKLVYEGANDRPGILTRFANSVAKAQIPTQVSRYLQIVNVHVMPEANRQFLATSILSRVPWKRGLPIWWVKPSRRGSVYPLFLMPRAMRLVMSCPCGCPTAQCGN